MSTRLTILCGALLWGVPLMLLTTRLLRPKLVSWWVIVLGTAALSCALTTAEEQLRPGVVLDEVAKCRAEAARAPARDPDCPTPLVDYWSWPLSLKWVPGIAILLLFLPLYGLGYILAKRTRGGAP
jgi:hypothetical protein